MLDQGVGLVAVSSIATSEIPLKLNLLLKRTG